MRKLPPLMLLALISILFNNSCKKDEPSPDPEPEKREVIVNDLTRVMPLNSRQHIQSIDPNNFTFVFNGSDDFIADLKVGNILVDSMSSKAPNGYLRKIIAVTEENGIKRCETELVTLPEAIPQGKIDFHTGSLSGLMPQHVEVSDGVTVNYGDNNKLSVFSLDFEKTMKDPNNSSKKVTISGHTTLDLDFFFDFDWGWDFDKCPTVTDPTNGVCLSVYKFETGVEIDQSASISVVSESGATFDEEISIAEITFDPWVFTVASVPVVFVPKIELIMNANGEITAVLSSSTSESMTGRLGVKWNNSTSSFSGINEWEKNLDFTAPELEEDAHFEAHVGPHVSLLLYGSFGPYVNLTGCNQLNAHHYTADNTWDLDYGIGISAKIGLEVDILGWEENFIFKPPNVDGVDQQYCLGYWTLLELDGQPFENKVYITYPIDGSTIDLNAEVNIKTQITGQTPDEVQFFVDGSSIGSDNSAPFEMVWNTAGYALGAHTVTVKEIINGSEISNDESNVTIQQGQWVAKDMSYMLSESSEFLQIYGVTSKGDYTWIYGGYPPASTTFAGGFIWKSEDNGLTWDEIKRTDGDTPFFHYYQMKFINEETGITINRTTAGSSKRNIFITEDGGLTFTSINPQMPDVNGFAFTTDGNIVAVHDHAVSTYSMTGQMLNTYDFGDCTYVDLGIRSKGNTILLPNNDYDSDFNYLISRDGGSSWNQESYGFGELYSVLDVSFASDTMGWAVGMKYSMTGNATPFVLKTIDSGNSWSDLNISSEAASGKFQRVTFVDDQIGYVWGSEGPTAFDVSWTGIYKTKDGGLTWSKDEETLVENVPAITGGIFFNGPSDGYVVGIGPTIHHYTVVH